MRNILSFFIIGIFLPIIGISQIDTTKAKGTDSVKTAADTAKVIIVDTTVKSAAPVVSNCYKDWYDFMRTRGAKPVTDGTHEVVVAFKTAESCICFMGKIDVVGGKIKPPLYIQSENGSYRAVSDLGRKMDQQFATSVGADLWDITDGMSVLFKTTTQEYGRIFFYKFANKSANSNKEAPSLS